MTSKVKYTISNVTLTVSVIVTVTVTCQISNNVEYFNIDSTV